MVAREIDWKRTMTFQSAIFITMCIKGVGHADMLEHSLARAAARLGQWFDSTDAQSNEDNGRSARWEGIAFTPRH